MNRKIPALWSQCKDHDLNHREFVTNLAARSIWLDRFFLCSSQQRKTWSIEIERQIRFTTQKHWSSCPGNYYERENSFTKDCPFYSMECRTRNTHTRQKKLSHVFIVILPIIACAGRFVFRYFRVVSLSSSSIGVTLFAFYAQKHFISILRIAHACFGLSVPTPLLFNR